MLLKALIFLLFVVQSSYCSSDGADASACVNFLPDHPPFVPQTSPSPYVVTTAPQAVNTLSVTIATTTGAPFRGFLIQARTLAGAVIGQFNVPAGTRLMACPMFPAGSVATHSDPSIRTTVTFIWQNTANFAGTVYFHATAVENFATFWTTIHSAPIVMSLQELSVKENLS